MSPAWQVGAVLGVLGAALVALAQDPVPASLPAADSAKPATYWLRVKVNEARLRARADANSVAVVGAPRDTALQAVGEPQFGWHRVSPPAGAFSFVSGRFVEIQPDGSGAVNVQSGNLRVRVGSALSDLDPSQSDVQVLLAQGARVKILGRQGDWLKIAPPENVYLYVSAGTVERVSPEVAARLKMAAGPTAAQGAAPPEPPPVQRPIEPPDLSGAWGQRLQIIETEIDAAARKPVAEQAWANMVLRLRPVAAQREEPMVARLAAAWIERLEQRAADQAVVQTAREVADRKQREEARSAAEQERIRRAQTPASAPAFDARGELLASLAPQPAGQPRRYKLHDPVTGRVLAYVEALPGCRGDPQTVLGQYVGVRGERSAEAGLGAPLIRAREIVLLAAPASQPTREAP
jgi:hypothetical protein